MIVVTGASGFVGKAVVKRLCSDYSESEVVAVVRREVPNLFDGVKQHCVGDLAAFCDWSRVLDGAEIVVHCAARVHVMGDSGTDSLAEFRRVNVEATLRLAEHAVAAGVKRFIFISSIKVNGDATSLGKAFKADGVPSPHDAYGISKYEAELALRELALQTGLEIVVIRPPLVYGPGVKANFASMMRWLRLGIPLPLGSINNRRSLVALGNLVDLIALCTHHPAATGQTFLVSDGEDVSTTQLLRRMADALGRQARLIPIPGSLLEFGAALIGRRDMGVRLCGSLQVDISETCRVLDWHPPLSVDDGLREAAGGLFQ